MDYEPRRIESKWQRKWAEAKIFEAKEDKAKEKFYGLVEFPYPSGEGLHVGHLRSYTALDIICRKRRMEGKNVLYPIGFDSFGLPTENYAIKTKTSPSKVTSQNIKTFTRQLKSLGFSFDWSRRIITSDPNYYKWTQWIFVKLFEHGLAYKAKKKINWCTDCKIGLANEEVVGGACERCGGRVVQKEKEQWILKITQYADKLLDDLKNLDYLDRIKEQQINWIGRSLGAEIDFRLNCSKNTINAKLKVFTTRPDTIYGVTFLVISPQHNLIENAGDRILNLADIKKYLKETEKTKINEIKNKTGIKLEGVWAVNPATKQKIPIFVADYVSLDYGTGAIMAVPAHDRRDFEFAKNHNLPIINVVVPTSKTSQSEEAKELMRDEIFEGEGININSGPLDGLKTQEAIKKSINLFGRPATSYHLRDWIFSRQRYWGEPIPMIYCKKCGWQAVPEEDLPVRLPEVKDFIPTDKGDSPLAKINDFIQTVCPKCGTSAKRETDVMPNWAGSNWYFLRYCDPHNKKRLADKDKLKYWMPVDWYNGGMEHTTLHLLYSRFIYKFLSEIGEVPVKCGPEPYKKRTAHGMILGEGGVKMSKSKGNVVNPDDYIQEYGADTVRTYEMFMGPFDQTIPWEGKSVIGVERFLKRVWQMGEHLSKKAGLKDEIDNKSERLLKLLHQTIKKTSQDIEEMKFNTAISQLMIFLNQAETLEITREVFEKFLILLSPFAPHLSEELWEMLGHNNFIAQQTWPDYDEELIKRNNFNLIVQINGKTREIISCEIGISEDEAKKKALTSPKIIKWLEEKEINQVVFVKNKLINFVIRQ